MATFNFSFDPGTSLQQMTGFQVAGQIWSGYLKDNLNVNIHVGVSSSLPKGVIGGALPGIRAAQNYKSVARALVDDARSSDDLSSSGSLQTKADYEAQFDTFDLKNGNNKGSRVKTKAINLTSANAKSLNVGGGNSTDLDGVILLSGLNGTNVTWDYDFTRSSTPTHRSLDFLSTAIHEIAHVLGFVSGVDKPGWLNSQAGNKAGVSLYQKSLDDRIANTTVLDLFRYSTAAGVDINDLSYGSAGSDKFFSVDGGRTSIANFATGEERSLGGDGGQASHWKDQNNPVGIMSPTLDRGARVNVSRIDLKALDVIGWDVDVSGVSAPIDWSRLVAQAKQQLASRLGQSVTWLENNQTLAAQNLSQSRDQDVSKMISQSQIYKWDPGEDNPFWQKIQNLYFSQGLFQKIDGESMMAQPTIEINWTPASLEGTFTTQPTALNTALNPVAAFESLVPVNLSWAGVKMPEMTIAQSYRQLASSDVRKPKSSTVAKLTQEIELNIKGLELV